MVVEANMAFFIQFLAIYTTLCSMSSTYGNGLEMFLGFWIGVRIDDILPLLLMWHTTAHIIFRDQNRRRARYRRIDCLHLTQRKNQMRRLGPYGYELVQMISITAVAFFFGD